MYFDEFMTLNSEEDNLVTASEVSPPILTRLGYRYLF